MSAKIFNGAFYAFMMVMSLQNTVFSSNNPPVDEWIKTITQSAPDKPVVSPKKPGKVLLFSLSTGYTHQSEPHVDAVIKMLAEKTGAFTVEYSRNIADFETNRLITFDAIILNNNCPNLKHGNLFYDALKAKGTDTEEQCQKKAMELEKNLLDFVSNGGGLTAIHAAIAMQNNSEAFSEMRGASFKNHPPQQQLELTLVDPNHPITKAFDGKPFIHTDEPYIFKGAYSKLNFHPLLAMDLSQIKPHNGVTFSGIQYVSWIKRYGKGRVFFVSPAHNAKSFEDTRLVRFILNGIQYTLGDLKCDDSPLTSKNSN